MSDLVIAGAGGFGFELSCYALEAALAGWLHTVIGFLDDDPAALARRTTDLEVLGAMDDARWLAGNVVIGLGDPVVRRRLRLAVADAGGTLVSIVHPRAYVAPGARVGAGAVVAPGAFIGPDSTVAANSVVNALACVGHDARLGADAVLSPYAALGGFAEARDGVMMGTKAVLNPGVRVGSWSRVAAGSVVTRDYPDGSLLVGNPAKGRVMFRTAAETESA